MVTSSKKLDEVPRRWPCPVCGEYISFAAAKCRFCGEPTNWLPALEIGTPEAWNAIQRAKRLQSEESPEAATSLNSRLHDPNIELLGPHDSGLFGAIWRGRQIDLGRQVAVKIIFPTWNNVTTAIAHAKALARVNHANIVTVYQVASVRQPETGGVVDAVIMEWLEGEHLGNKLAGPLFSLPQARNICEAIVNGLEHMHERQLAHGDLHPGNVFVADTAIKIIDISYADSRTLQLMSHTSRETRINADIDSARFLCRRVIYHAQLGHSSFRGESELSAASSLAEIRNAVRLALSTADVSPALPTIDDRVEHSWLDPMRRTVRAIRVFAETSGRESTVAYGRFPNAEQDCRHWAEQLRSLIHREQLQSPDQRAIVTKMIEICDEVVALYLGGLTLANRQKVSSFVSALDKEARKFAKSWLDQQPVSAHKRIQHRDEVVLEGRRMKDVLAREAKFGMRPTELQASASAASNQIAQIAFSSPPAFDQAATAELQRIALALYDAGEMMVFLDGGESLAKIRTGIEKATTAMEALVARLR